MKTVDFTLVRSDRKSVAIQVKRDGTVVVRAPRRMTDGELERIVEKDRAWIERQLERMSSLPAPPPEPTPDELRELTELKRGAVSGALRALSSAAEAHFELEKIYGEAMDFAAKERFTDSFIGKIF